MSVKPKVFVGSSTESRDLAVAVKDLLSECDVTVWRDAINVGENIVDGLIRNLRSADVGVFVFAADDLVIHHDDKYYAVRDNVIFEYGMFVGGLGKESSLFIVPNVAKLVPPYELRLPSDTDGIVHAHYDPLEAQLSPRSAMSPPCRLEIAPAIKNASDVIIKEKRKRLDKIIRKGFETVCRAMSVPHNPGAAGLRAFVFLEEIEDTKKKLVCKFFWDPDFSEEEVDKTKFMIDKSTADRVVVVKCFLNAKPSSGEQSAGENEVVKSKVAPLGDHAGVEGNVTQDIKFVLAAPIKNQVGEVVGVVDFDACTSEGMKQLNSSVSKAVIFRLAQHLQEILFPQYRQ